MGESFEPAPPGTRLGKLQRGHGAGFLAALADPAAARDEVLACVAHDPRLDTQCEARVRYYADLVTVLPVPLSAIVACTHEHDPNAEPPFAHEVLAACWRRGHADARELLSETNDEALVHGVGRAICGHGWQAGVDLPPGLAAAVADVEREWGAPTGHVAAPCEIDATTPIDELFRFADRSASVVAQRVLPELCRRTSEGDRARLAAHVGAAQGGSVQLAAKALGRMGDVRLLERAQALFAREDDLGDPGRRLPTAERIRRVALLHYFVELPGSVTLPLARQWRGGDDYLDTAALRVLACHAEPIDRPWLEAEVTRHLSQDGGWRTVGRLQALTHIGDARSAQVFLTVVDQVRYSHARMRAVEGLARMPDAPGAAAALRDALWDSEEGAAAAALGALPTVDPDARARVAALASDPLACASLRGAASRCLART